MYTAAIISLLLGTALALPNGYTASSKSTTSVTSKATYNACQAGKYNALNQDARVSPRSFQDLLVADRTWQFENDNAAIPLVAAEPIDEYLDLYFNGMTLLSITLGPNAVGVIPQSPDNVAAFGVQQAATVLQGQPALTSVYDDSTIFAFDFHDFFFGLVLADENAVVSAPESGSVTVTGIDTTGRTVATQTFEFVANGLQQQMIHAVLGPEFSCLRDAVFQVNGPGGLTGVAGNATLAALSDNYNYTVYGAGFVN